MTDKIDEIIALDRQRFAAMKAKDFAFLESLLADDYVHVHSSASIETKQSLLGKLRSGQTEFADLEVLQVNPQDLGEVVVLIGMLRSEGKVNEEPVSLKNRFIATYARRGERWQIVASQATRVL